MIIIIIVVIVRIRMIRMIDRKGKGRHRKLGKFGCAKILNAN